jgi:predicted metal-dependent hydrolase
MNAVSDARFRAEVAAWVATLKVVPAQVRVQAMTRKWASCSTAGRVTFCRELLGRPRAFREYVIVHELLHLRIPNHGKLFRTTLAVHLRGNRWLTGSFDTCVSDRRKP